MDFEIRVAVDFLTSFMNKSLIVEKLDVLKSSLRKTITTRFIGHWYPEKPNKGSGYRCISISDHCDQVLFNAMQEAGLDSQLLKHHLPKRLDLWIDPGEVAYRIGEQGSVKMIYKYGKDHINISSVHYKAITDLKLSPIENNYLSKMSDNINYPSKRSPSPKSMLEKSQIGIINNNNNNSNNNNNKKQKENRLSPTAKSFSSRRSPSSFLNYNSPPANGLLQAPVVSRADYHAKSYWGSAYDPLGLSAHNYLLAQELALYEAQRIALQSQYYKSSYFQWLRRQSAHQQNGLVGHPITSSNTNQSRQSQLPILA